MEQLDLNQIRTFVKLVQLGSFTKAAEAMRQPKSRVSRRLAALEKDLGVQLIYRTTRQFQLTETGKAYFERARGLIEGLEVLSVEVSDATSEISGNIKITASDDMGVSQLPVILEEFGKLYPQVRFDVMLSQAYVDLVKESVDVAFRIGHLKDSSLKARKVGLLRSIIVASPGLLERHRHWEDLEKIAQLPFVVLGQQGKVDMLRVSDGKKVSLKVKPVMTSNNPAFVAEMAVHGRGFAAVPEFLVADYIRQGRLVHVFKNLQSEEIPVNIVIPEQKEVPLKIKKFVEFSVKRMKELYFS